MNKPHIRDLKPKYTKQKSFYGKALIIDHDTGKKHLQSNHKKIATTKQNTTTIHTNKLTNTNIKHLIEYLKQEHQQ